MGDRSHKEVGIITDVSTDRAQRQLLDLLKEKEEAQEAAEGAQQGGEKSGAESGKVIEPSTRKELLRPRKVPLEQSISAPEEDARDAVDLDLDHHEEELEAHEDMVEPSLPGGEPGTPGGAHGPGGGASRRPGRSPRREARRPSRRPGARRGGRPVPSLPGRPSRKSPGARALSKRRFLSRMRRRKRKSQGARKPSPGASTGSKALRLLGKVGGAVGMVVSEALALAQRAGQAVAGGIMGYTMADLFLHSTDEYERMVLSLDTLHLRGWGDFSSLRKEIDQVRGRFGFLRDELVTAMTGLYRAADRSWVPDLKEVARFSRLTGQSPFSVGSFLGRMGSLTPLRPSYLKEVVEPAAMAGGYRTLMPTFQKDVYKAQKALSAHRTDPVEDWVAPALVSSVAREVGGATTSSPGISWRGRGYGSIAADLQRGVSTMPERGPGAAMRISAARKVGGEGLSWRGLRRTIEKGGPEYIRSLAEQAKAQFGEGDLGILTFQGLLRQGGMTVPTAMAEDLFQASLGMGDTPLRELLDEAPEMKGAPSKGQLSVQIKAGQKQKAKESLGALLSPIKTDIQMFMAGAVSTLSRNQPAIAKISELMDKCSTKVISWMGVMGIMGGTGDASLLIALNKNFEQFMGFSGKTSWHHVLESRTGAYRAVSMSEEPSHIKALTIAEKTWRGGISLEKTPGLVKGIIQGGLGWTDTEEEIAPYLKDWCGAFVAYCWAGAGLPRGKLSGHFASTGKLDTWGASGGAAAYQAISPGMTSQGLQWEPRPGDIVTMGGAPGGHGTHIGMVKEWMPQEGVFITIEGNTSGEGGDGKTVAYGVAQRKRKLSYIRRIIRPE